MNRRQFLAATAAAVGAFALDPERLLYVPGRKTYFDTGAWSPPTYRGMTVFYDEDLNAAYFFDPRYLKITYLKSHWLEVGPTPSPQAAVAEMVFQLSGQTRRFRKLGTLTSLT